MRSLAPVFERVASYSLRHLFFLAAMADASGMASAGQEQDEQAYYEPHEEVRDWEGK